MRPTAMLSRMLRRLLAVPFALSLAAAAAATTGDGWPQQGYLRYEVYREGIGFALGLSEHRWQRDADGGYRIATQWETSGLAALFRRTRVHHTSEGRAVDGAFLPARYRTWREDKKKEAQADFDWAARRVAQAGGTTELPAGTLDPVAFFYQAALSGRVPSAGELRIANGRRIKTMDLAVIGEEKLALFDGTTVPATHLRATDDDGETTDLWIAASHGYLPLKIAHTDRDGGRYYQLIREMRLGGDALAQDKR
jgi:hypothetical protein